MGLRRGSVRVELVHAGGVDRGGGIGWGLGGGDLEGFRRSRWDGGLFALNHGQYGRRMAKWWTSLLGCFVQGALVLLSFGYAGCMTPKSVSARVAQWLR